MLIYSLAMHSIWNREFYGITFHVTGAGKAGGGGKGEGVKVGLETGMMQIFLVSIRNGS